MNKVKKILSLMLGVAMALSMMAVPALAADGTISGDCKLLLPSEGTIKVDYQLKDADGNDVTEGVTYSITSEDANLSSYANIDSATGELYLGTQAAGKTFTVTATSASVTGSLVVTAAAGYSTDFENEVLNETVANSMFVTTGETATTAKVVTEGTMEALPSGTPDPTRTNKIAQAYYYGTAYTDMATRLVIKPADLNAKKLTIEAKVGVLNTTDFKFPKTGYPISVSYTDPEGTSTPDSVEAYFEMYGTVDSNGQPVALRMYKNAASTGASTRVQNIGYCYELIPTKLVLENNNTVSAYINGVLKTSQHKFSTVNAADFLVNEIIFGSYVDDIEIYSGEKVSGGYEIVGDSYICRAPEGTSANIKYTAEPSLPWAEEDPSLYLALKAAHSGVSVSGMTVTVAGNATAGDFVLQLKNAAGNVVGEKTVTIVDSVYKYALNPQRYFVDFQNQTEGTAPNTNVNNVTNRKDYGLVIGSSGKNPAPVIKKDGDNLYLSAQGRSNYTVGATAAISVNADDTAYKMQGVTCGTFEADFMAESAVITAAESEYSLFSEISSDSSSGLDIRYDDLGDGSIVIYSYTGDDGHGKLDYNFRKTLAVVPADTWFNFRIEADFVNKTYDLYINNRKVVNDAKHDMDVIGTVWFGAAIDNVAVYHGSKVATEDTSGNELRVSGVKQGGFAYNTNISVSGTGNKSVAIQLSDAVTGLDSNSKIIIAQYNSDNQMKSCTIGAIKLDGGVALACSVLDTEVEQGDYFKVFLWNFEKLVPLR